MKIEAHDQIEQMTGGAALGARGGGEALYPLAHRHAADGGILKRGHHIGQELGWLIHPDVVVQTEDQMDALVVGSPRRLLVLDVVGDLLQGYTRLHPLIRPLHRREDADVDAQTATYGVCTRRGAFDGRDVHRSTAGLDGTLDRSFKFRASAVDARDVADDVVGSILGFFGPTIGPIARLGHTVEHEASVSQDEQDKEAQLVRRRHVKSLVLWYLWPG